MMTRNQIIELLDRLREEVRIRHKQKKLPAQIHKEVQADINEIEAAVERVRKKLLPYVTDSRR
jgi:hypothetical protein